ncbi:hypothetical protein BGZ65_008166, partial [Modicella reniformis]
MSSIYFPPSASALHQKRRKAKKHAVRVPRPKNSFMHYRSDISPLIMIELGMINNKLISKIAAERWNAESETLPTPSTLCGYEGGDDEMDNDYNEQFINIHGTTTTEQRLLQSSSKAIRRSKRINSSESDQFSQNKRIQGNSSGDKPYGGGRRAGAGSDVPLADITILRRRRSTRNQNQLSLSALSISSSSAASPGSANKALDPMVYHGGGLGYPLMEQQFYLAVHQQQQHQQQQQQQQQRPQPQQLSSIYQAHPLGPIQTPLSTTTSIYGVPSADANASSVTLVDPVNHWMTHRYVDSNSVMEHYGFSNTGTSTATTCAAKKVGYLNGGIQDKELPPLPHEAGETLNIINDPNLILSQLYSEYNNNPKSPWVSCLQGVPNHLIAAKEPEPPTASVV